jgi:hypothetical protein
MWVEERELGMGLALYGTAGDGISRCVDGTYSCLVDRQTFPLPGSGSGSRSPLHCDESLPIREVRVTCRAFLARARW